MIDSPYLVRPGKALRLKDHPTDDTGKFKDREDADPQIEAHLEKLRELQGLLYAESKRALLVVLQAMDTGGKDGTIKHVFSGVNPQSCQVTSFKVPTPEELAHDYLWRIHTRCPGKGVIGIFNRSHYESVLVERVHKLVPKAIWSRRYGQINSFEKLLADEGTVILKFFLHISKAEQKRRLEDRLKDRTKNWKFNPEDIAERRRWGQYMGAYQEALERCSTGYAPWFIVPADHKWFRNWVVSDTIVRTLQQLDMKYPPPPKGLEKLRIK